MTMEKPQNKKLTIEGNEKILEFLPKFQDKEFNSGTWHLPERIDGVTLGFPYYECSPLVGTFLGTLCDEDN